MNINNTQPGYIPTDSFIENNGNKSNIDQLLSIDVISTTQPSLSVTFNPINMIPSQNSLLSNMQQQNNLFSSYWHQFEQRRQEQQRLRQEQHEQREQRRRQYERDPEEHRYIGYMLRLGARNPRRFEEILAEQAHQDYLDRRSPTFNEDTDEIFQERQLEDYNLERMTPQERREIWEQQQLNQLQENPAPRQHELSPENLERYAVFLRDQLLQHQHEQAMQIEDMEPNDYK